MKAKKSFGQHFLKDNSVITKIIDAADLSPTDTVVEIGPGLGALTQLLYQQIDDLILIEADRELLPNLETTFPEAQILSGDAASLDYVQIVPNNCAWILVSNLPYNSANAILRQVLSNEHPPKRLVVMVQKEVGEKMLAQPGDMSLLSVSVQIYAQVNRVCNVKPGAFNPPPKVDSMVLRLEVTPKADQPEAIIALAKSGFANKRKQLHKNLAAANLGTSKFIQEQLQAMSLPATARAEELSVTNWIQLFSKLNK